MTKTYWEPCIYLVGRVNILMMFYCRFSTRLIHRKRVWMYKLKSQEPSSWLCMSHCLHTGLPVRCTLLLATWSKCLYNIIQIWTCDEDNMEFYGSEATILTEVKPRSILLPKKKKKNILPDIIGQYLLYYMSNVYLFIYLYFDRITYIISEAVQINIIVFSKVLWSVSKILIV